MDDEELQRLMSLHPADLVAEGFALHPRGPVSLEVREWLSEAERVLRHALQTDPEIRRQCQENHDRAVDAMLYGGSYFP